MDRRPFYSYPDESSYSALNLLKLSSSMICRRLTLAVSKPMVRASFFILSSIFLAAGLQVCTGRMKLAIYSSSPLRIYRCVYFKSKGYVFGLEALSSFVQFKIEFHLFPQADGLVGFDFPCAGWCVPLALPPQQTHGARVINFEVFQD